MTRIAYTPKNFRGAAAAIIEQADAIMIEYAEQGYSLTLRQLYYQFVARALFENDQKNYKRLGEIVNDARMAGLLDWDNIEDRTRGVESLAKWDDPQDALHAIRQQYKIDLWEGQSYRPEVWIEKEALVGVVEPICEELRVDYLACRGYVSASEAWRAAMRIVNRFHREGQRTTIFHFGDHDPSGIDMTRDLRDRLQVFCSHHLGRHGATAFTIERLALNMDQVQQYDPPPNPAKTTDSRFEQYQRDFGDESWELDALDPSVISAMVQTNVERIRNDVLFAEKQEQEDRERNDIQLVTDNFDDCVEFIRDRDA